MNQLLTLRYDPGWRQEWDATVAASKNATFLLARGYMDYHADRFEDHSLMIVDDYRNLVTALPACQQGDTLVSHAGLTYGGFVMSMRTSGVDPLEWFDLVAEYMHRHGFKRLVYKPVPHIYHLQGADEDLYALFRANARLTVRNLATVVNIQHPLPSSRLGRRAAKRAARYGITVAETGDVASFWHIIERDRLERHNVHPVHTLDEMQRLHDAFPANIRCFTANGPDGAILAGAVVYVDHGVVHLQYAAANADGREQYAVDVIYRHLVNQLFADCRYFDFGTSNEDAGRYLNTGMVEHKEEFGARSVIYDTYTLTI